MCTDNCLTTQTTMTSSDTNGLPVAGISGGVGAAFLVVHIFLCMLLMVCKCSRGKKAIHTAIAASNAQCKSESAYDYIDSTDLPSSNQVQDAKTCSNVSVQPNEAYGAHTNSVIMAQSNEAYGVTCTNLNNESVVYESIDPAVSDKSKDEFETEANCAYGTHSDVMVVSPNHAYGVHVRSKEEEDVYYI